MIRIQLSDAEVEALEHVLRTTADAKLRHRAQIVLMAHRGRPHPTIVADTGTSQRSVQRGLNASLDGGLDRLRPRKAKGGRPQADRRARPDAAAVGHRRPGRAGPGPGPLDLRRVGRPPLPGPGHPGPEVGRAGVLLPP
jgi:hypothetical protein